jgi:hypothetical protein
MFAVDLRNESITRNKKFHGAANWTAISDSSLSESEIMKPSSLTAFSDLRLVVARPTFAMLNSLCGMLTYLGWWMASHTLAVMQLAWPRLLML